MSNEVNIQKKIIEINECIKKNSKVCDDIDWIDGISSYILFQYHFYIIFKTGDRPLISSLKKLYNLIPNAEIGLSYSTGLPGVFNVLNYLNEKNFIDEGYKDAEQLFSQLFCEKILYDIEKLNLDFLHGSSGILMYLTNRRYSLEFLLNITNLYFEKLKIYENNLIAFPCHNFEISAPDLGINLSLSHGNSAIICVLSKIFQQTNNIKIEIIINNIFNSYFIIKEIPHNRVLSLYPHTSIDLNESRMAWCYGDLGIACAFWQAGKTFNNAEWKQEAVSIMLNSSKRRDLKENKIIDAGICHGTAGIAHIFNRFYKETHIKEFDDARWYWLNETLNMAKFDDGLAGYKSFYGNQGWRNEFGLLEGIAGIGLVLLGFLTDDLEDLSWDRCLLLS